MRRFQAILLDLGSAPSSRVSCVSCPMSTTSFNLYPPFNISLQPKPGEYLDNAIISRKSLTPQALKATSKAILPSKYTQNDTKRLKRREGVLFEFAGSDYSWISKHPFQELFVLQNTISTWVQNTSIGQNQLNAFGRRLAEVNGSHETIVSLNHSGPPNLGLL